MFFNKVLNFDYMTIIKSEINLKIYYYTVSLYKLMVIDSKNSLTDAKGKVSLKRLFLTFQEIRENSYKIYLDQFMKNLLCKHKKY